MESWERICVHFATPILVSENTWIEEVQGVREEQVWPTWSIYAQPLCFAGPWPCGNYWNFSHRAWPIVEEFTL